jgi:Flp pilus assembly protein TadG
MSIRQIARELKTRLSALGGARDKHGAYRRFLRGEGGAIAIYFGLSAIVFVGVAGLAVDAARGYLVKARLSEAIDAAALAGGKALALSDNATVLADANAFFDANFPNGAMGATVAEPSILIQNNRTIVSVSGSAVMPTTLMRVLGFEEMTMAAAASVTRATTGLDVVFSFDVSGSMNDPSGSGGSKISTVRTNAALLVDTLRLPFTSGGQSQTVNVNGTNYSLLNIGIVPWNSKVNVRTRGQESTATTVTTTTVPGYTDPTRRQSGTRTTVFNASNSQVRLLRNPNTISGGWRGCVYARYMDDGDNTNDADTTLGYVTVGNKTWPAWEPVPINEGDTANCEARYWNSDPSEWPYNNTGSGRPSNAAWRNPASPALSFFDTCDICPTIGIQPLTSNSATVYSTISALTAGGATDAPQGLFWAYEVLMPGAPFNEAVVNPPFRRAQAIVFMTDGENVGSNGDAYHGWFGASNTAGTMTTKGTITIPHGGGTEDNNLNGRLLQVAATIKGANPMDPAAVKIYVIQYQVASQTVRDLLEQVATQPGPPYYYFAADGAALADAFRLIAADLTALRLVQ